MPVVEGDVSQVLTSRKALFLCNEHLQAGQSYPQYLVVMSFAMRYFSSTLAFKQTLTFFDKGLLKVPTPLTWSLKP